MPIAITALIQEVADVKEIRAGERNRNDQDDQADQRFVLRQKAEDWVHCSQSPKRRRAA
jgi:hypothetical protein